MQRVEKTMTWGKQELSNQELTGLCGVCLDEHLYRAAALGHAEIVNCLLKCRANPNKSGEDYKTPLHAAMEGGHERTVWALLCQPQIEIDAKDSDGNPPLLHGFLLVKSRPNDERAARVVSMLAQRAGLVHLREV